MKVKRDDFRSGELTLQLIDVPMNHYGPMEVHLTLVDERLGGVDVDEDATRERIRTLLVDLAEAIAQESRTHNIVW